MAYLIREVKYLFCGRSAMRFGVFILVIFLMWTLSSHLQARETHDDNEENPLPQSQRESQRESQKERQIESQRERQKESQRERQKESQRESQKESQRESHIKDKNNIAFIGSHESQKAEIACIHPKLELWHPDLRNFFKPQAPLTCTPGVNWVYVHNGTLHISSDITEKHGTVKCDITPYKRPRNDFHVMKGETIKGVTGSWTLQDDFVWVECVSQDGKTYSNDHSGVAYKANVSDRPVKFSTESLGLNVVIIGFDTVSKMTGLRNLPSSHDYFVNDLGGILLEGYNVLGDGTGNALGPFLTGKSEEQLPQARRGRPNATTVDKHPWIWNKFKEQGYVTQWAEDVPGTGTFTYLKLGFNDPPVDHYMRPFYLQIGQHKHKPFCLGSTPVHVNHLNYISDLFKMYPNKPKFTFSFQGELSHDHLSKLRVADKDIFYFIKELNNEGHLNNSLLIMMSDHGPRFSSLRRVLQGKYEERMPYMGLRFPPWFSEKYPEVLKNLHTNVNRLTTPFDIHETLMNVINFTGSGQGDVTQRGISVMKEIPASRTCEHAHIPRHWCACLDWKTVTSGDSVVMAAANALVARMNSLTQENRDQCALLTLNNVTSASLYTPNDRLLKYKKKDPNKKEQFTDNMSLSEVFYQIALTTKPNQAAYEATVKYRTEEKKFVINTKDISRINAYGDQSQCVMENKRNLFYFCYCITK